MDDEHTLPEVDARLRAALSPDDIVAGRVTTRALADAGLPRRGAPRLRYVGALAALALALSLGAWQWRRLAPVAIAPAPLAITGQGSIVVVEHPDGRRWIVGPPPERRTGGNYVIVLER